MTVTPTPSFSPECVTIRSGRVMQSSDPKDVGRWHHFVAYVDAEGFELHDYSGESYNHAGEAAVSLARDFGCRIIDRAATENGAAL